MQIRSEFPRPTRTIANTFIPLADGTRLAARIWLPRTPRPIPCPRSSSTSRTARTTARPRATRSCTPGGPATATPTCASTSGAPATPTGSSSTSTPSRSTTTPLEVLAWLAAQPWCTGKVGIIGKSWGGFNGLQIAARRPPELAGVISVASTDDRYADRHPLHRRLRCTASDSCPGRRRCWPTTRARRTRCSSATAGARCGSSGSTETPPFLHAWVSHQRRDEFWKHGSVCEDYSDIEVPVYMVGGWQDGYTDAIFRFMEGYRGPRKGLCGPWGHVYPQSGLPKPAIGFLQDSLRFWDRTLKGIDNGMLDGTAAARWIQEWVEPADAPHVERPGRWVAESAWPPVDRPEPTTLHLRADGSLAEDAGPAGELPFSGLQHTGLDAGAWTGWGFEGDDSARPARRGRALALLHLGAAARAHRDAGLPGGAR